MPNVFCNLKKKFRHGRKDRENTSNTLDQYEYHSLPSQYRRSTIPNVFRNLKERFRRSRKDRDYRKSNSDTQLRNPIPSNDYNKSSSVTQPSMVDLQPNDDIQPTTDDEMYGYVTPLRYYQRNQKPGEMTEEEINREIVKGSIGRLIKRGYEPKHVRDVWYEILRSAFARTIIEESTFDVDRYFISDPKCRKHFSYDPILDVLYDSMDGKKPCFLRIYNFTCEPNGQGVPDARFDFVSKDDARLITRFNEAANSLSYRGFFDAMEESGKEDHFAIITIGSFAKIYYRRYVAEDKTSHLFVPKDYEHPRVKDEIFHIEDYEKFISSSMISDISWFSDTIKPERFHTIFHCPHGL